MRLKSLIARYFRVHVSEVHTRIIGEHGESMVPLWSATTIGGIQIRNLPRSQAAHPGYDRCGPHERPDDHQGQGFYDLRAREAIATLVRTILGDENRILTVSSYITSEIHGIGDVCIGVPARLNRDGLPGTNMAPG